jgi:hypothetical protein
MATKSKNFWMPKPEMSDYAAAHDYLTLLFSEAEARKLVQRLRKAPVITRECGPRADGQLRLGETLFAVSLEIFAFYEAQASVCRKYCTCRWNSETYQPHPQSRDVITIKD